jgi:predicted FMN-binding regulatory protein PaiB
MDAVTAKFKLGQNLKPEVAARILEALGKRQAPEDARTAEAIKQHRPKDK